MAGLRGQVREPQAKARARRNSQNLASSVPWLGPAEAITITGDGYLTLSLADDGGLEVLSSELQIKLNGTTLSLSTSGLKVETANLTAASEAAKGVVLQSAARTDSSQDTITLSSLTDPADTPADADTLRDDLVANTLPSLTTRDGELETAIETLAGEFNDLLAKLRTAGILNT